MVFSFGLQAGRLTGFVLVAGAMVMALSGCATSRRGGDIPYGVTNFNEPDPIQLTASSPRYRIAPGDLLTITVRNVEGLSQIVEIESDGTFDYPLIGKIQANGLSTGELRDLMQSRLGETYLQSPSVDVSLKSTVANQVTLDGSVTAPGFYPIAPGTTLLRAIAMAKGPTTDANLRRVVVFRQIGGQRNAAACDPLDIRRGKEPDPEIFARDIIVIDGSQARKNWTDMLSTLPLLTLFRPF